MKQALAGRPTLVKVGRFDPDKNWMQAVDALAELHASGINARMIVRGGREPYADVVFARAHERGLNVERIGYEGSDGHKVIDGIALADGPIVHLRAFLDDATLYALYAAADAVLANSGKEPFGLVGLEVMAAGGIAVTRRDRRRIRRAVRQRDRLRYVGRARTGDVSARAVREPVDRRRDAPRRRRDGRTLHVAARAGRARTEDRLHRRRHELTWSNLAKLKSLSDELVEDLLLGNKILFKYGVVDAFGHVSVRHDSDPQRYVMSRHLAPGLVTEKDLLTYDLDSVPVPETKHRLYSERFIHGEIYKARPDVMSVVHCHAASLIPFGITKAELQPVYHVSAFLGLGVPKFDIRQAAGMTDMLVRTARARRERSRCARRQADGADARSRRDDGRQLDQVGGLPRDVRGCERAHPARRDALGRGDLSRRRRSARCTSAISKKWCIGPGIMWKREVEA